MRTADNNAADVDVADVDATDVNVADVNVDEVSVRLARCLNPKSIAVIGGVEAAQVISQCHKLNFAGDLWAVNPKRHSTKSAMHGLDCYPNVDALPKPPDAAFIAIPADGSIQVVAALSQMGAGGAVCYAAGFKETGGDGNNRHQHLIQAAGAMPVIGPNCYGFINLTCGAALWPDYHGASRVDKGVAIFSQSGNVSLNLSMQRRLLPLAWLVTVGNQAVVGIEECIAAALASACITAIGMHIEGLGDVPRFAQLAEQARQKGIPMIALKAGASETGARITMSHTATLAGEGALYDALFERLGIGVVATPEEFIETLKLASVIGALPGNRIASMSCSGGEATLVADLASQRALHFPPPDDAHRQRIQSTLNAYVRVDNPLDYHTFIWGDRARMTDTFTAMMSGNYDLTLLILDIPPDDSEAADIWLRAVQAFIAACHASGGKGALVALLGENLPPEFGRLLLDNNIAPLQGLAQALAAIEAVCHIGNAWARRTPLPTFAAALRNAPQDISPDTAQHTAQHGQSNLDEYQAKKRLAAAGFCVPQTILVDSIESAVAAANQLGYPVVVKAVSTHITHKTEMGAVAVDLRDAEQVHKHATAMLGISGCLMVEKMIEQVVAELLLGVGYDWQFGHYLIIGCGGALVELISDRQLLLPPVDESMLRAALNRLKTAPLLDGYRGRPVADKAAVIRCALRLNDFLADNWARIIEIEINPLMVKSENQGVVAADALMTMRDA